MPADEDVDEEGRGHGVDHAEVGEGQGDHQHVGRGPKGLDLEEDVADQPVPKGADDPEAEEEDAEEVLDRRVGGRELGPVGVGDLEHGLRGIVRVLGACWWMIIDQASGG